MKGVIVALILTNLANVKWNRSNKKHYQSYGYSFTELGDTMAVKIKHLPMTSGYLIKIKCRNCEEVYESTYHNFNRSKSKSCRRCYLANKTTWDWEAIDEYIRGNNWSIKLLTQKRNGITSKVTLNWRCLCGDEFRSTFNHLYNGAKKHMCNDCSYGEMIEDHPLIYRVPYKDVKKYIDISSNSGATMLTTRCDYKNVSQLIDVKCSCGNVYKVRFSVFKNGHKRQCNECLPVSSGENQIKYVLDDYSIQYEHEVSFDDLRGTDNGMLRFDFAIYDNGDLISLVEYDGRQHFESIDFFGGLERFEYQQKHDNIKNQYCKDNNIPLLRIPYWDFDNIEQILEDWLIEHDILPSREEIA